MSVLLSKINHFVINNSHKILKTAQKSYRRLTRTPFIDKKDKKLIIHCCYHKIGTYWLARILRGISDEYGMTFQNCEQYELRKRTDIFLEDHSCLDFSKLPPYVGSHMIRDPRDVVISGYFYHLWTNEDWAHIHRKEYGNLSYQQYLNSLDQDEGILAEIKRSINNIREMAAWNYNNPNFIEIKYEDLITNEQAVFYQIFKKYGFNEEAIQTSLKIAEGFSFKNMAKRAVGEKKKKSHLRSGKPGEWKTLFNEKHKSYFKELTRDAIVKLGYEISNDW